jgi:hypothetical protein
VDQWQRQMASVIKRGHVAAMSIAKGGREQVTQSDWGRTAQIVRTQYDYLYRFARQLEDGRPVHGGTIARAKMYALAATGTYENQLRRDDLDAGYDVERRILHSVNPCRNCVKYAAMGWQSAGVLPGIGQRCQCLTRCRCTFERYQSEQSRRKRKKVGVKREPKEPPPGRKPDVAPPEPIEPTSRPPATIGELKSRMEGKGSFRAEKIEVSKYVRELQNPGTEVVMMHSMEKGEEFYSMDWNGSRWYYRDSGPDSPLVHTLHRVGMLSVDLPENLTKHTGRVVYSSQSNMHDAEWAVRYNTPGFKSHATGGSGGIVVYNDSPIEAGTLIHEMGHNLADAKYGNTAPPPWSEYRKAMDTGESPPSIYGMNSPDEDFADSVKKHFMESSSFQTHQPRRHAVVKRLLEESDYGG